ncbi:dehydrogenase [Fusarium mundagurra]|uniref:Dehydrogenase n=1 Tax=Fusarium mundagurra TaxID=1567541 RepID=A0A8H6DCH7_9HYPO|nr:dehydrogenase [Fusarium mundagurra]
MNILNGNALVTGAGSGIGRQLSLAYVRAGVRGITLADVNKDGVLETGKLIQAEFPDAKVLSLVVDVTNETSVNDMVDQAVKTFGTLDYAANAAGVVVKTRAKSAHVPTSEFDRVININTRAVALCMQAEARAMLSQPRKLTSAYWQDKRRAQIGSIVNFASVCGFQAMLNVMPYVASKHAVLGMTRSAALEHGPEGLRVNAVCPGIADTPFIADLKALKGGNEKDPVFANPLGRLCYPDEIADAVVFLSSTMSSYVNGIALVSDGGKSVQY